MLGECRLTLSPALAAILLPEQGQKKDLLGRLLDFLLGWFFRLFNWVFQRGAHGYTSLVGLALRGSTLVLVSWGYGRDARRAVRRVGERR